METTICGMIFHNERPMSENLFANSREELIEKAKKRSKRIRQEIDKEFYPNPLRLRIWPE